MPFCRSTLALAFLCACTVQASLAAQQEKEFAANPVQFSGLHRVPEATLRHVLGLGEGEELPPGQVRAAVAKLHRTGWFEAIRVEREGPTLTFVLLEFPFLAAVEYSGSRLLDRKGIESALDTAGAIPQTARPADPLALHRASQIIIHMLQELGHPYARVHIQREPAGDAAVRVTFQIFDGPYLPVLAVRFEGATAFPEKTLLRQMKEINPHAWFAGLRHKNIFSAAGADADAQRLAGYYQEHGYTFARVHTPRVREVSIPAWRWFPGPRKLRRNGVELSLRVEGGPLIRWESFAVFDCYGQSRDELLLHHASWKSGAPHSPKRVAEAREVLAAALPCARERAEEIDTLQAVDRAAGTAHVTFRARPTGKFQIRRIEFAGHRRFPDRFYRRRLGLAEGDEWAPDRVNQGLAAISRGGFVKAVEQQQVKASFDKAAGTVDLTVRVTEAGRQRISLVGGASTIGIAYNLFNLFGGEEILTGYLEGGPPSLNIVLGIAKDGLLGNRATLGLSLFHNVLRPRLPGSRKERLFTASTTGFSQSLVYFPSTTQSVGLLYQFDSSSVEVPAQDSSAASQPASQQHFARSEVAASWQRPTKGVNLRADVAASGGWLGGSQRLARTSAFAVRRGSFPGRHGEFAARSQSSAVFPAPWMQDSSVPFHSRLYPGEDWVRGLRAGELGTSGLTLVQGANLEYGQALTSGRSTQLVGFVDGAIGWLRGEPGSASRFSFGLELRWRIPEGHGNSPLPLAGETIRLNYSLAPWRAGLGRRSAWGWALGQLF